MERVFQKIADELAVRLEQVAAAVRLLDEGATVPFIARYRKEATGGLDDTQLRNLQERLRYLRELEERREVVLRTIREQGKPTPELETAIQRRRPRSPSRTSTFRTSRSGGPRPRWPAKQDSSRWLTPCWPIRPFCLRSRRPPTSTRKSRSRTLRQPSRAHGRS